jgi:hypothetical protein
MWWQSPFVDYLFSAEQDGEDRSASVDESGPWTIALVRMGVSQPCSLKREKPGGVAVWLPVFVAAIFAGALVPLCS